MEQKDLFIGYMEDLADRAPKMGFAASKFLTPAEAQSVAEMFRFRHVSLSFDGGYDDAERTRAIFHVPDRGGFDRATLFAALQIDYRMQDTLGHRDILGALMALGIERDTLGDIVMADHGATLVCVPEMADYIADHLTMVGRVGIRTSRIALDAIPARQEKMRIKTDTVASLRLDAVLSVAFGLSRAKAADLITAQRVHLNHSLCTQVAKECDAGALLSVRGLGRAKLLEVGGKSKKGRIYIKTGSFIS